MVKLLGSWLLGTGPRVRYRVPDCGLPGHLSRQGHVNKADQGMLEQHYKQPDQNTSKQRLSKGLFCKRSGGHNWVTRDWNVKGTPKPLLGRLEPKEGVRRL